MLYNGKDVTSGNDIRVDMYVDTGQTLRGSINWSLSIDKPILYREQMWSLFDIYITGDVRVRKVFKCSLARLLSHRGFHPLTHSA